MVKSCSGMPATPPAAARTYSYKARRRSTDVTRVSVRFTPAPVANGVGLFLPVRNWALLRHDLDADEVGCAQLAWGLVLQHRLQGCDCDRELAQVWLAGGQQL